MLCPDCEAPTRIIDTRVKKEHKHRRRECTVCCLKFTTKEYPLETLKRFKEDYLLLQREVKRLRLAESLINTKEMILK